MLMVSNVFLATAKFLITIHLELLEDLKATLMIYCQTVTERLSKIYIARYGYTWLDGSKWPQEWPISPITIIYLNIPSEKMKSLFTQDWVLSLDINRFQNT